MTMLDPNNYPGLPKWPNAFVTGKSVTVDQARDIIQRTDHSISYITEHLGNDRRFSQEVTRLFGWDKMLAENEFPSDYYGEDGYLEKMRYVDTRYVHNDWLASAYIGGPNGWCHPDGTILQENKNFGKWPSVQEIADDWRALLEAFPYLELVCTLFDAENCEHRTAVCSIVVGNGFVEVHEPDLSLHSKVEEGVDPVDTFMAALASRVNDDYTHEHAWPWAWVLDYAERSTKVIDELMAQK